MSRPHTHEALKSVRCAALKLGMRSFVRLECFALTENALGFFRVWIGLRPVAAVRSVERLRMSADANFIADHVTLVTSVPRVGVGGNRVFSLHSLSCRSYRGKAARKLLVQKGQFNSVCIIL